MKEFAQDPILQPYVESALARAGEPHMAPLDPLLVGAILLVLPAIQFEMGKFKFDGREITRMVEKLTGLVKALPGDVSRTLFRGSP